MSQGSAISLHALREPDPAAGIEEAGAWIEPSGSRPERDAEIEAKAIDMERGHPMAQRVHDHLQHARMREVQRVAGARVVDQCAR